MAWQRPSGGTLAPSLAAIFGSEPAEIGPAGTVAQGAVRAPAEVLRPTPYMQFGWQDQLYQTDGMTVLYVDQVIQMPQPEISTTITPAVHRSAEAPGQHPRNAFWMYRDWDPIYRFANTDIDLRFAAGHVAPLTNEAPGNLPAQGARMLPQQVQLQAWRTPRFQTTPYTIIPTPTPGNP